MSPRRHDIDSFFISFTVTERKIIAIHLQLKEIECPFDWKFGVAFQTYAVSVKDDDSQACETN